MGQVGGQSADHQANDAGRDRGSRPAKLPNVRTTAARESLIIQASRSRGKLGPAACRPAPDFKRKDSTADSNDRSAWDRNHDSGPTPDLCRY